MTEGARAVHKYLGKSDDGFYGKTQALTVAFNGETFKFYGHHALQIPPSSQPAGGVESSADITVGAVDTCQYPQYLLAGDNPRDSFEDYQSAYKHTRNAEDIGFKWATERKDALWAYTNRDNTQTPPDVRSAQPPNDSLVSISSGTPDDYNYDAYDDGALIPAQQPTDSLIPVSSGPPDGYNCDAYDDDAQTYNQITPPQSSKDVSVLLESEPREDVDFNARSHRKTRARTRHAVAVEEQGRLIIKLSPERLARSITSLDKVHKALCLRFTVGEIC